MGALIELDQITRSYQMGGETVYALKGISLVIEPGEYVAIMGPSGSGKSTLMHILGLLDRPSSGRYLLRGRDVTAVPDRELALIRNREIGFVFQSFYLLPRVPAWENVALPLLYGGVSRADRRRRAEAALVAVGMGDRLQNSSSKLSGGQQQRVAIARALVAEPSLVLADEPTGNLDLQNTGEVLAIFDRLNREGQTVVLVTHEEEVAARARRRIRVRDGRIESDSRQEAAVLS